MVVLACESMWTMVFIHQLAVRVRKNRPDASSMFCGFFAGGSLSPNGHNGRAIRCFRPPSSRSAKSDRCVVHQKLVVHCQTNVLQVVLARHPPCCLLAGEFNGHFKLLVTGPINGRRFEFLCG